MDTNVFLKIKFLVLLADDSTLVNEKYYLLKMNSQLPSSYCHDPVVIVQLLCSSAPESFSQDAGIQNYRRIIQKVNIFNIFSQAFKVSAYLSKYTFHFSPNILTHYSPT